VKCYLSSLQSSVSHDPSHDSNMMIWWSRNISYNLSMLKKIFLKETVIFWWIESSKVWKVCIYLYMCILITQKLT